MTLAGDEAARVRRAFIDSTCRRRPGLELTELIGLIDRIGLDAAPAAVVGDLRSLGLGMQLASDGVMVVTCPTPPANSALLGGADRPRPVERPWVVVGSMFAALIVIALLGAVLGR